MCLQVSTTRLEISLLLVQKDHDMPGLELHASSPSFSYIIKPRDEVAPGRSGLIVDKFHSRRISPVRTVHQAQKDVGNVSYPPRLHYEWGYCEPRSAQA